MAARDLAIQNFAVANDLVQLHELFKRLRVSRVDDVVAQLATRELELPPNATVTHAKNDQILLLARAGAALPQSLLQRDGIKFLLRQAVLVTCSAVECFFWDALEENILTVIKATRQQADESIRELRLTIGDYLSLESYEDPNERLKQIVLKNFNRSSLAHTDMIEKIACILSVRDYWQQLSRKYGSPADNIKSELRAFFQRRHNIIHRADRPGDGNPDFDPDGFGLRSIGFNWVSQKLTLARGVVDASSEIFEERMSQLLARLEQEEEQRLAQQTLNVVPLPPQAAAQ